MFLSVFTLFFSLVFCDGEKPNLIKNIAFEKDRKTGEYTAVIFLNEEVNPEHINIMGSEKPEDPESYTIVKVMDTVVDYEENGNRINIPLDYDDLMDKKKTYAIQIAINGEYYHSESFQFDESAGKFKLKREMKSTGGTTAGWIIGVVLGAVALLLVLILIFCRLCR